MDRLQDPMVFEERLHEPDLGDYFEKFNAFEWMADERNIVFLEGDSLGVFEYDIPHVYTAHYMFRSHRGKEAKELSLNMLRKIKNEHDAKVIRGIIEVDNRASRWMTRQLGFKSHGIVDTIVGPCEIFTMNLNERFSEEDKNG